MNRQLIKLGTSTGTLFVSDETLYLFYDRSSGFCAHNNSVLFFNNIHHDIQFEKRLVMYRIFYTMPLHMTQSSLSSFFRTFLTEVLKQDFVKEDFLEDHQFHQYIWKIGELTL